MSRQSLLNLIVFVQIFVLLNKYLVQETYQLDNFFFIIWLPNHILTTCVNYWLDIACYCKSQICTCIIMIASGLICMDSSSLSFIPYREWIADLHMIQVPSYNVYVAVQFILWYNLDLYQFDKLFWTGTDLFKLVQIFWNWCRFF